MAEKLERLKLKHRGQRGVVTKLYQEATSLLEADLIEPSSLRCLRTIQGVLREKQVGLKTLDDEITDTCPIDEVERETIEAEELSGTIVECIDHISSVISEKTERRCIFCCLSPQIRQKISSRRLSGGHVPSRDLCLSSINSVMCEHVFSLGCQRVTRGYEMEGKLDELSASFKELKETQDANRKEFSEKLEKLEKDVHTGQDTAAKHVVKKLK